MRKKLLFISLVLVLVLGALIPGVVLAAKPTDFSANGIITYIELPGDVFPAEDSGRWVVASRYLDGTFLESDVTGDFTLTYKANVDSEQAGNLHGILTFDTEPYVLKVNGTIQPLDFVTEGPYTGLPKLTIDGRWTFIDGARGQGEFDAWLIFIPFVDHVGEVVAGEFVLDGKWQP